MFYTGVRRWPNVGTLADLIERGDEFRAVTLIVEQPRFVNLPEIDAATLERDGGFFGWLLRRVQQRRSRGAEFEQLLERVVTHRDSMGAEERQRWRDLLSYIGAMIYHESRESEQTKLQEAVGGGCRDVDDRCGSARQLARSVRHSQHLGGTWHSRRRGAVAGGSASRYVGTSVRRSPSALWCGYLSTGWRQPADDAIR